MAKDYEDMVTMLDIIAQRLAEISAHLSNIADLMLEERNSW